jgi:plasmid maintenance system antidote protein VapI
MDSPRRHIHLGTRLETAEKVRRGELTAREAADRLGVREAEVAGWLESEERPVTIDEVVVTAEARRLTRRAQRLLALIEEADAAIREMTQRLGRARGAAPQGAE